MKIEHVKNGYGWRVIDDQGNITYFGEYVYQGVIYKDYDAYKSGNGVCYIDEYGFENEEQNMNELFEFAAKKGVASELVDNPYFAKKGYTRKDIIEVCEGDEKEADFIFETIDWQSPESIYDEIEPQYFR